MKCLSFPAGKTAPITGEKANCRVFPRSRRVCEHFLGSYQNLTGRTVWKFGCLLRKEAEGQTQSCWVLAACILRLSLWKWDEQLKFLMSAVTYSCCNVAWPLLLKPAGVSGLVMFPLLDFPSKLKITNASSQRAHTSRKMGKSAPVLSHRTQPTKGHTACIMKITRSGYFLHSTAATLMCFLNSYGFSLFKEVKIKKPPCKSVSLTAWNRETKKFLSPASTCSNLIRTTISSCTEEMASSSAGHCSTTVLHRASLTNMKTNSW